MPSHVRVKALVQCASSIFSKKMLNIFTWQVLRLDAHPWHFSWNNFTFHANLRVQYTHLNNLSGGDCHTDVVRLNVLVCRGRLHFLQKTKQTVSKCDASCAKLISARSQLQVVIGPISETQHDLFGWIGCGQTWPAFNQCVCLTHCNYI